MRSRVVAWVLAVVGGLVLGGSLIGLRHAIDEGRACVIRNSTRLLSDPPSGPLESCPSTWWLYALIVAGLVAAIVGSVLDLRKR